MSLRHRSTGDGSDVPYEKIESFLSPPEEEEEEDEKSTFERYKFLLSFFVSFLAYSVFSKKVAISSKDYPYALTELSPLSGLLIYGTILFSRYVYEAHVASDDVKKRNYEIPFWKPALIGTLFSIYNLMYNLGNRGSVVQGGIVLLISKLVVVFSGIMSSFPPLKKKLNRNQIGGLCMLFAGAAITLTPRLSGGNDTDDDDDNNDDSMVILYVLLLISAQPVLALAMLIVEYQVTSIHKNLDLIYLWFVVCLFESFVSLLLAPINASIAGISISNIPVNLRDGLICVLEGRSHVDDCQNVPLLYIGQVLCGCCFNLSMAASVKNSGGATLMWFVRAVTLPFGAILFCIPWIMGDDAESLSWYEFLGIFLVTAALYIYSIRPIHSARVELTRRDTEDNCP